MGSHPGQHPARVGWQWPQLETSASQGEPAPGLQQIDPVAIRRLGHRHLHLRRLLRAVHRHHEALGPALPGERQLLVAYQQLPIASPVERFVPVPQ